MYSSQAQRVKPFAVFEQEFFEKVRPTSLLKRFETVDEIASVVAFVCSPLAAGSIRVEGDLVKAIACVRWLEKICRAIVQSEEILHEGRKDHQERSLFAYFASLV